MYSKQVYIASTLNMLRNGSFGIGKKKKGIETNLSANSIHIYYVSEKINSAAIF